MVIGTQSEKFYKSRNMLDTNYLLVGTWPNKLVDLMENHSGFMLIVLGLILWALYLLYKDPYGFEYYVIIYLVYIWNKFIIWHVKNDCVES